MRRASHIVPDTPATPKPAIIIMTENGSSRGLKAGVSSCVDEPACCPLAIAEASTAAWYVPSLLLPAAMPAADEPNDVSSYVGTKPKRKFGAAIVAVGSGTAMPVSGVTVPAAVSTPKLPSHVPIDDGSYNANDGSWTLSDTHAQFATMTQPANDHAGTTFIYGHGTDAVFGKIGSSSPPSGTIAEITTDNGHVFTYVLQAVKNYEPSDTSVLQDTTSGQPRLVVQTCTGAFSEWRTMFIFTFEKVSL